MREALVMIHGIEAAVFLEKEPRGNFELTYLPQYQGPPISLRLPLREKPYQFEQFPPFFDGLLPEGAQLEALLREAKIDRDDHFSQLLKVGRDMVGAVTVKAGPHHSESSHLDQDPLELDS